MEKPNVPGEFPEEIKQDVDGLAWLGHLEDEFTYAGHHFVIRTLKADEELYAAILAKEWMDTLGQAKAWAWAHVAQCIVSVDHDEEFCPPLGPNRKESARGRFQWMIQNWYWHLADFTFARYLRLVERQAKAIEAIEDLSPGNPTTSTPSPDSSTEQGDLPTTEEGEDIQDLMGA